MRTIVSVAVLYWVLKFGLGAVENGMDVGFHWLMNEVTVAVPSRTLIQ